VKQWNKKILVKEQRVDGSRSKYNNSLLRCTLTGFEKNYQVKVLSKQLNKNKFSTSVSLRSGLEVWKMKETNLAPWFVTAFCDAEASFTIALYLDKRIKGRAGWVVKPSFQISLNSRDIELLLQLQKFFLCVFKKITVTK